MLRTEFEGIENSDLNGRIDALYEEFLDELRVVQKHLTLESMKPDLMLDYYRQNAAVLAYNEAEALKDIRHGQVKPFSFIKVIESQLQDIRIQSVTPHTKSDELMTQRPGFGVWGWLTGDLKKQRTSFLDALLNQANADIQSLQKDLQNEIEKVKNVDTALSNKLSKVMGYYSELYGVATTLPGRNILDKICAGLDDPYVSQFVPGLLLLPLAGYTSPLAAVLQKAENPQQEAVLLRDYTTFVNNDAVMMAHLALAAEGLGSADKARYNNYLNALRGQFMPLDEDVLLNINSVAYATLSYGKTIKCYNSGSSCLAQSTDNAGLNKKILTAFLAHPNFIKTSENTVLNINSVAYFKIQDDGRVSAYNAGGSNLVKVEAQYAAALLEKVETLKNFISAGNHIVNANMVADIDYNHSSTNKLALGNAGGKAFLTQAMPEDEAIAVIEQFTALPHFMAVNQKAAVNLNVIADVDYNKSKTSALAFGNGGGRMITSFSMDEAAAADILKNIAKRPNFYSVTNLALVNLNNVADVDYNHSSTNKLAFGGAAGRIITSFDVSYDVAAEIIADIAQRPNFINLGEAATINSHMVADVDYGVSSVGKLSFGGPAGKTLTRFVMAEAEAQAVIAQFAQRSNVISPAENSAVNIMLTPLLENVPARGVRFKNAGDNTITTLYADAVEARNIMAAVSQIGRKMAMQQFITAPQMAAAQQFRQDYTHDSSTRYDTSDDFLSTALMAAVVMNMMDSDPVMAADIEQNYNADTFEAGGGDFGGGGASGDWGSDSSTDYSSSSYDSGSSYGGGGSDYGSSSYDSGSSYSDSGSSSSGGGFDISCDPRLDMMMGRGRSRFKGLDYL